MLLKRGRKKMETAFALFICIFVAIYGVDAKGLFESSPHIEHITEENIEKKVLKSDRVWLLEFYNAKNKESKASVLEIEKTARILAGIARVGVVDVNDQEKLAHQYDAKDTPTVILFGEDKQKPTLYKDKLEANILIKKVGSHVKNMIRTREEKEPNPKKDVVKLTGDNFEKKVLKSDGVWFVKYYDPNCAHSREFAPEYAKAAAALKGAVYVGAANMDVEPYDVLGEPYNIEKVPMVKIFGANKAHPPDYDGARKANELIDRGLEELEMVVRTRIINEQSEELYGGEEESEDGDEEKNEDKEEKKKEKEKKKQKNEKKEEL